MKIKNVEIGSIVKCCGAIAKVITNGSMGTRVNVTKIPEDSGFTLGFQIWSNETLVESTGRGKT